MNKAKLLSIALLFVCLLYAGNAMAQSFTLQGKVSDLQPFYKGFRRENADLSIPLNSYAWNLDTSECRQTQIVGL